MTSLDVKGCRHCKKDPFNPEGMTTVKSATVQRFKNGCALVSGRCANTGMNTKIFMKLNK